MLLQVLALTAALSSPSSAPAAEAAAPALAANAYIVECLVSGVSLTQCKVVDADRPPTPARPRP